MAEIVIYNFNKKIVSGEHLAIALVVYLVSVTKDCQRYLHRPFKLLHMNLQITATQMIAYHFISSIPIRKFFTTVDF